MLSSWGTSWMRLQCPVAKHSCTLMDYSDWQSGNNRQRCIDLPSPPLLFIHTSCPPQCDAEHSNQRQQHQHQQRQQHQQHQQHQQQQQSSYRPQHTAADGDTAHAIDNMQSPAPSLEELHHNNSLAGVAEGGRGGGYRPSRPTSTHQRPREHTATHDRPRNTRQRQQAGCAVAPSTALLVLAHCGACLLLSYAWHLALLYCASLRLVARHYGAATQRAPACCQMSYIHITH